MAHETPDTLTREVEVIRIPTGEKMILPAGAPIIVTQALGDSFTILVPSQAGLYRLEGQDADAIGRDKPTAATASTGNDLEQTLWDQLKTCYDPEIPVNIVDLGLIYTLTIDSQEGGGKAVSVQMTLTAPGCGMGPILAAEARQKILSVPGIETAQVDLVWDPPWTPDRISEAGRQKLGMI